MSQSQTRDQYPLSTKKVLKKTLAGTLIWSILLLVCFSITFFISINTPLKSIFGLIFLGIILFLFFIITLTYLYQLWYYHFYYYDFTPDYIVIKKGPITPREITIPYERVQDVYVDQDLLDRIFGLYDVHLSSATISSGMEAHIDGLEKLAADGLRGVLLKTVSDRISRHQQSIVNQIPTPPPTPAA